MYMVWGANGHTVPAVRFSDLLTEEDRIDTWEPRCPSRVYASFRLLQGREERVVTQLCLDTRAFKSGLSGEGMIPLSSAIVSRTPSLKESTGGH